MKSILVLNTAPNNYAAITLYYPDGSTKTVPDVDYESLDPADKITYDNFKGFLPLYNIISFDNLPIGIDGDMLTSSALDPGRTEVDYNNLSVENKSKVDSFVALIEKLFV